MDYAVDLRRDSSTYLQWVDVELSADNQRQIYIPKGFGHVFLSLEDHTKNVMRFDEAFDSQYNRQIAYDDPQINIEYPIKPIVLAEHDRQAPNLVECDIHII